MAEIQTEHCVEIRVPLEEGDYSFGSGYTLGPHWVLTAHHVLFPEGMNDAQPIEITWWDESGTNEKDTKLVDRDELIWYCQAHDIALIRCKSPYENVVGEWSLFAQERPKEWAECKCAGFLSKLYNEEDNQRRKTPTGKLGAYSSKEITVDINDLSVSLKKDKFWAGFSGSPVFAEGKLAAVIRTVNLGEHGAGLVASFVAPALDIKGGRHQLRLRDVPQFLIPPDDRLWKEKLRLAVIDKLQRNKEVYERIKAEFQKLLKDEQIKDEAALADALASASVDSVIICFLRVFTSMQEMKSTSGVKVMEYLARIWLTLVAVEHSAVDGIAAFKKDQSAKTLSLNAVKPVQVDVEAQAANGERREPQLQLTGEHLRSPMDLTPNHKTGLDTNDRQASKDVVAAYNLKNRPGLEAFTAADVKNELEQFVTRPETGLAGPIAPDDDKERGRQISKQLLWDSELSGGSFYIRLQKKVEAEASSALRDLHPWCPQLLVFEVTEHSKSERSDALSGLYCIIYLAQRFLAGESNRQDDSA